jgi:type IV pilus assembly protein PilM
MPALALDIGTYTIKAVSAKPGAKPEVSRVAEAFNTSGISTPNDDAQIQQLADLVNTVITDHKLPVTDVRLSLPESAVSTKVISVPRLTDAELASAIGWQAEQYIPIPPEELALEYEVLYRPDKKDTDQQMRVLLVGARKPVIERYVTVFSLLGIEPTILETQLLSVIRSLQFEPADATTLVVHIGAATMSLGVIHQGELVFVFNHMSGGQMLSRSLEQNVGLAAQQAEEYKRTYGLQDQQFQGKITNALRPAIKVLTDEMIKAMRFFTSQYPTASVSRVLLSGGTSQLPGLVQEVTQNIGVEVLVASPFASASGAIPEKDHAALTVCMGLLMREL